MKITVIAENTSGKGMPVEHGLSIYVETDDERRILFDMGQGQLFADNADRLKLKIEDVDAAVVSHGHYDHGGGLRTFLERNSKAMVYVHKDAFMPHYSLRDSRLRYIGLDKSLEGHERITACSGITTAVGMKLFADVGGYCCYPPGNRLLYGPSEHEHDSFGHEQSMVIEENGKTILFAGCAHRGIINIMRRAEEVAGHSPTHVVAGMHLMKSGLDEETEKKFINTLADKLMDYGCMFYTMHCTGMEQYSRLKQRMGERIEYIACGDCITI